MGAVYQAWDEELAVVVAIKVIRPETLKDAAAVRDLERRFKRELLLARNVTHKNVVRIHDLGEVNGIKYITMPYVHGSDLAKVISREGRLPIPRALAIARQIAAGLVAAHEAGIVHRDLKPGNILLDEEDHALITDFGIARSVSGPGGGTIAGTVVGTLEYMAPEQAKGATVDHRADIYAFGLILSDMLIGRRKAAHTESAMAELFERMTKAPPSLSTVDATIPDALDAIVACCVAPDPAHRYQTTHDLVADLDAFSGDRHATVSSRPTLVAPVAVTAPAAPQPTVATVLPRRAPSRRWLAGAGIAVIIALGAVGFLVRDRSTGARQRRRRRSHSLDLALHPAVSECVGRLVARLAGSDGGQHAANRGRPICVAANGFGRPCRPNSRLTCASQQTPTWIRRR